MTNQITPHQTFPLTSVLTIHSPKHGTFKLLIDTEDAGRVGAYRWRICKNARRKSNYAMATENKKDMLLHRFIMGATERSAQVDHIAGGASQDNRKSNLRICSPQQNSHNQPDAKGYSFDKVGKNWVARITYTVDKIRKGKTLGAFDTEAEASSCYQHAKKIRDEWFSLIAPRYDK